MDTAFITFLVGAFVQNCIIVLHAWRRFTNISILIKHRNKEPTKAALGGDYHEAMALIEFTKLTFAHSSIGSIVFMFFAAAFDWYIVVGYFAFYALVVLPAFRYQLVKHRKSVLFSRVKPTIKF